MARTVNYPKRAEKIKEMIDDLVKEMGHSPHRMSKKPKIHKQSQWQSQLQ